MHLPGLAPEGAATTSCPQRRPRARAAGRIPFHRWARGVARFDFADGVEERPYLRAPEGDILIERDPQRGVHIYERSEGAWCFVSDAFDRAQLEDIIDWLRAKAAPQMVLL